MKTVLCVAANVVLLGMIIFMPGLVGMILCAPFEAFGSVDQLVLGALSLIVILGAAFVMDMACSVVWLALVAYAILFGPCNLLGHFF